MTRTRKSSPIVGMLLVVVTLAVMGAAWAMSRSSGVAAIPTDEVAIAQVQNGIAASLGQDPLPTQPVLPTQIAQPTQIVQPTVTPIVSTYVVQSGDYFSTIASKFGVSVEDLAKANPQIADLNAIIDGQVINLPQPSVVAQSASADTGTYGQEDVTKKWENLPPPTVSGGNIVQRGEFWEFADSFLRVIKTENGETSWSSLIKVDGWNPSLPSVVNGVSFYWPEDYIFTGQGRGNSLITFSLKADNTEGGYDYAAAYGDTGKLSLYVTGINGRVYLSKDNGVTWKDFELSSGKPGIDFPKGSTVMFKIVLGTDGGEGMYTLSIGPQDSTGDAPAY